MTDNRHHDKRLLGAANMFMRVYLSDGVARQPEDFDREILGETIFPASVAIAFGQLTPWNKTIFADALGDLVEEGSVKAWQDELGWHYQFIT